MHPYSNLPDQNFWRRFVSDTCWRDLDLIGTPRFRIQASDRVCSAGSCFAQHLARHMQKRSLSPYQVERAHPLTLECASKDASYEVFSARFGNIYTSRQCWELYQQAFSLTPPVMDFAEEDGRVYDLLRPNAIPDGFASREEAEMDRIFHLSRVREMFSTADVFVFTLGLTERWYNCERGHTYPVCPGTARGTYDDKLHAFKNLRLSEVVSDLRLLVEGIKSHNPAIRIILTVSPVPLVATYSTDNVLVASSYSKSVLRAACGEICEEFQQVQYFPSYEIISHGASFGQYLKGDLREVTERGVGHVMDCFFRSLYADASMNANLTTEVIAESENFMPVRQVKMEQFLSLECEEMFNDVK